MCPDQPVITVDSQDNKKSKTNLDTIKRVHFLFRLNIWGYYQYMARRKAKRQIGSNYDRFFIAN